MLVKKLTGENDGSFDIYQEKDAIDTNEKEIKVLTFDERTTVADLEARKADLQSQIDLIDSKISGKKGKKVSRYIRNNSKPNKATSLQPFLSKYNTNKREMS